MEHKDLVRLTADVVSAWAAHNPATPEELVGAIAAVHRAFETVGAAPAQAKETPVPAVPIRKSVTPDYLICLEDGRKLKMLKRYLRTAYNMSPEEYRAKWDLPANYPMVAPNYAASRSELAKSIGLGRKRPAAEEPAPAAPKRASRRRKSA
jgi:predicted transcriptional regulator